MEGRKTDDESRDITVLAVNIKGLGFRNVCVVKVGVWSGAHSQNTVAEELRDKLQRVFHRLVALNMRSIVITNINDEFGIPSQICAKCLCQAIASFYQ